MYNDKTAYDMRIIDWSSDVCCSDLGLAWLDLKPRQVAFFLDPRLAVPGTLPRQQHVHQRTRLVGVVDRQLHQPAGVGMDGRLAQLRRIHLAKALEAGHVDRAGHALLAVALLALDLFQRSEEHTSELQSLMRTSYAAFCLKKKTH